MENSWSTITLKMSIFLLNYLMSWSLIKVRRQSWLHWLRFSHAKIKKKKKKKKKEREEGRNMHPEGRCEAKAHFSPPAAPHSYGHSLCLLWCILTTSYNMNIYIITCNAKITAPTSRPLCPLQCPHSTSCSAMRTQKYDFEKCSLYTGPNQVVHKSRGGICKMQKICGQ